MSRSDLRSEAAGTALRALRRCPQCAPLFLRRQRHSREPPGLVADGRDMGTIVFPAAGLKIFLTATPEERARRRHKQLKEKGLDVSLAALSREIAERDARDAGRRWRR